MPRGAGDHSGAGGRDPRFPAGRRAGRDHAGVPAGADGGVVRVSVAAACAGQDAGVHGVGARVDGAVFCTIVDLSDL